MNNTIRKITGTSIMAALVIALTFLSNYVTIGPVNISLALIPIVIGAYLYGPISGLFLGVVNGAIVLTAPSTAGFIGYNAFATVALCLLKTGIAGLVAGFMPMIFKNHLKTGVIVAAVSVPIINTGIFALGCMWIFMPYFQNVISSSFSIGDIFLVVIGFNFFIEFGINVVLSPTIYYIINVIKTKIMNKDAM